LENQKKIENIYLYEQVTQFYEYAKITFTDKNVIGSEYLGFDKKPGEIIKNIRHEDALNLSFENNYIDIIISNDVFEHVPDIKGALSESYRVLRESGKLVFSIPFYCNELETKKRATLENGRVISILPDQYHGNPISNEGSLVFYDFGWDILQLCREAGFKNSYMLGYYSFFYGYMGGGVQFVFVAEK